MRTGEPAEPLGFSVPALRPRECQGRLTPNERTHGGRPRYDLARPCLEWDRTVGNASRQTVTAAHAGARISTTAQAGARISTTTRNSRKGAFTSSVPDHGEIIAHLGLEPNEHKEGRRQLLSYLMGGRGDWLVATPKERGVAPNADALAQPKRLKS